ncbi:MAG TPA: penicillin-binding transpeptidase domain-containing protein [Nocardioides sp.]
MTGGAQGRVARAAAGTVAALVAGSLLVACSSDDADREDAERALNSLRQGVVAGDLSDVPLTGASPEDATAELTSVVAGLGDVDPQVTAGAVDVEDGRGTGTLEWSWALGGQSWSYTSTVTLRDDDGTWQVEWSPAVVEPSLSAGEVLRASRVAAVRGDVLAGDGTPIVTLRDVVRFGIDKSRTDAATAQASARALAEAVGIDADAYVQRVAAAGERAYVEAIVLRAEEADLNLLSDLDGIASIPDQVPLAPSRAFAAPVLGTVGEATAEVVEESGGAVSAGDVVGLSGLQRRYDDQLRGADGLTVVAVPAEGSDAEPRELHAAEATAGTPLTTSLDIDLQGLAEGLLADVSPASALVAVRPSDGALLAVANGPGAGGQNIATFGQYAPGSTFKVVTSLALLRSGVGPDDTVSCPAQITVDGRVFENYDDYPASGIGEITLRQAVASSCNTAFIGSADALGDGALAEAAASLGLGVDHDLGFPAYFGQVPAPETQTEAAAATIGQGRVLASPMAMATVAASVVAGRAVLPSLLPERTADQVPAAAPLTADEAAALQGLMRAVVTDGSGRLLADLPGDPVGAKTGTAEYGTETPPATHAWMIATRGDLAVAVFVETGASGSGTAGPVLRAFLAAAE